MHNESATNIPTSAPMKMLCSNEAEFITNFWNPIAARSEHMKEITYGIKPAFFICASDTPAACVQIFPKSTEYQSAPKAKLETVAIPTGNKLNIKNLTLLKGYYIKTRNYTTMQYNSSL